MEFFITIRADNTLLALASRLIDIGQQIIQKEDLIMKTLQDTVNAVADETTEIASLATFIKGLKDQIAMLPGMTPAMQTQIDTMFADVTKNTAAIAVAMALNVTPMPMPTVVPPIVA